MKIKSGRQFTANGHGFGSINRVMEANFMRDEL
jgi:hypothetical protein